MLPTTTVTAAQPGKRQHRHRGLAHLYFRRLLRPRQMDFQYTFWTMLQLCIAPKTAYRHTSYHKQTKNHWARDDPAFVVILCGLVAAAALVYGLLFSHSLGRALVACVSSVLVDFLGVGCAVATACWLIANRFLLRKQLHSHAVEQSVEWMYAFDVHCNSFFPLYLVLCAGQLLLCPLLLHAGLTARALSCALYALGLSQYLYLTFLGYSALPFLERAEVFLYPIGLIIAAVPLAILMGLNPTQLVLHLYWGR
eukprot:scaffold20.g7806.t1